MIQVEGPRCRRLYLGRAPFDCARDRLRPVPSSIPKFHRSAGAEDEGASTERGDHSGAGQRNYCIRVLVKLLRPT